MSTHITRLALGSKGVQSQSNAQYVNPYPNLSMFSGKGIRPLQLSPNPERAVSGYIMPARDSSLIQEDLAYPTSTESYRYDNPTMDCADIDSLEDIAQAVIESKLSGWFVPVKGYFFYGAGEQKFDFVSPQSISDTTHDPIVHLRMHIYKQRKVGDLTYMPYVTKEDKEHFCLPQHTSFYVMNFLEVSAKTGEPQVRPLIVKVSSMAKLLSQLNRERTAKQTVAAQAPWDIYSLGDVTDKDHALMAETGVVKPTNGFNFGYLNFGTVKDGKAGINPRKFTEEELAARYNLVDIINIPSYRDIVTMLIKEKKVPYDLIVEACGKYTDVMPDRNGEINRTGVSSDSVDAAPAPPSPAAPTPPTAPALDTREFWVNTPEGVKRMNEDDVWSLQMTGFNGAIMLTTETSWQTMEHYGFNNTPVAPTPPTTPEPPAAPEPPPAAPAPQAAATVQPTAHKRPSGPNVADVTQLTRSEEEEDKYNDFLTRCTSTIDPLNHEELTEFGVLSQMKPFKA